MKPIRSRWLVLIWTLGLGAGWLWAAPYLDAQQSQPEVSPPSRNYTNRSAFPNIFNPYTSPFVPEPKMSNSERLHSLIHDAKLQLSLSETIALALENNLDIDVARYTLAYAQTDVLRTKSGGATRGINPALFGGVTAFAGAGGVSGGGGTGGAGGLTGGGGATNLGFVGCCDPFGGVSFGWDRNTSPLNFTVVSGVPVVTTQTSTVSTFFGQGFLTGTSYVAVLNGLRQSTTSFNTLFNPEVPTGLKVGINQHLLNGFGYRANAKFIRIAKNDLKYADSTFRQQVITTVTQVLNLYSDLLYFRENVRVAQQALAYAEKLLADNKRQVEIGTLAPIEVVRAESEVATDQQNLVVAETNYLEQQETVKTAISKHVGADLASAQIEATDKLPEPADNDIPALADAIQQAEKNRPEISQAEINIRNQEITIQTARNGLLPTFDVFATYAPTGLSGNRILATCPSGFPFLSGRQCTSASGTTVPATVSALPSAGLFQSLTQAFHGNYPDYSFGASLQIPIRNRAAQADMATALLQERQLRAQLQQTENQVDQQVRNAVIAVTQAKAQINATHKATLLAQQTLDAEQKKFQLGESTVFLVIQAERDLVAAQGNDVLAHSNYSKALTQFGQATGTTLEKYNIQLAEAKTGQVTRFPNIPGTPVNP